MARYFFHIHDGKSIPDDLGHDLPDLDAARRFAVNLASDCLREHDLDFWGGEEWTMTVTNDRGLTLFSLLFTAINAPSTMNPH